MQTVPFTHANPIFGRLAYEASVAKLSRAEYIEYERSEKAYRDYHNTLKYQYKTGRKEGLKEGRKEGREEGLKEGLKEGLELGIKKASLSNAKNLLKLGVPKETIMEATGLTLEEINGIN